MRKRVVVSLLSASLWLALYAAAGSNPAEGITPFNTSLRQDSVKVTREMVITAEPLTVSLPLNAAFQKELQTAMANQEWSVTLIIRNLIPPKEADVTAISVFVENPKANAASSDEDDHYVGSRAFGEKHRPDKPESYSFNVKAALIKTKINPLDLKQLRFTFVPLSNGGRIPEGTKIRFSELELKVVPKK